MFRRNRATPETSTADSVPLPASPFSDFGSYADDVVDAEAVAALLRDTDIFGAAVVERDGYLADALERFRVTMSLIPQLPEGSRILELGANPYFVTELLLSRGLNVTCANFFGEEMRDVSESVQTVTKTDGSQREYHFAHFDVETAPFPYEDGAFDLVLCCEILEHLPVDPIHMLNEIHRVLTKPHGALLLTTPNAIRLQNLANILNGENVYESLSGYGVHGRHNREYTPTELRTLLTSTGFDPEFVHAIDVHGVPRGISDLPAHATPENRGDNLFALARASRPSVRAYEPWLFTSIHAIEAAQSSDSERT
jgi:2-polyprenyl-3-methyl-5-hydroxy-6-metoxy-1,4-benzoquinol methylase